MGRVSKRLLDSEVEERIFEIFWLYLAKLRNTHDIREFLQSLLSRTEQIMIAKRLAIAVLLEKGHTYEHIDQSLKVSKATIATVHRQILTGAAGYKNAAINILYEEKKERSWNTLEDLLLQLSLPKRHGSASWEKKSKKGKALVKRKRVLSTL